jgi:exosortase
MLKSLAFPLFLLLFMIRIPLFIYSQITFPLQLFASQVAEHSLNFIGIPVFREGNILELPSKKLSVVEACSGIRSLLSLTFLSLAYGYFFERRGWVRILLFILTVPIAIGANAFRVTITGILSEYKPELAEGAYHTFEGWVIFVVALVALVLCHRLLEMIAARIEKGGASKGGTHAELPA